jgi:hypothetical protein
MSRRSRGIKQYVILPKTFFKYEKPPQRFFKKKDKKDTTIEK